jgi:hypothetical protein
MASTNKPERDDVVTWAGNEYDVPAESADTRFYILDGKSTLPAGAIGCPIHFPRFKSTDDCMARVSDEGGDEAFVANFQAGFDVKLQAATRTKAVELWEEGLRGEDFRAELQAFVDEWKLGQKTDRSEQRKREREAADKARKIQAAAERDPELAAKLAALGF